MLVSEYTMLFDNMILTCNIIINPRRICLFVCLFVCVFWLCLPGSEYPAFIA